MKTTSSFVANGTRIKIEFETRTREANEGARDIDLNPITGETVTFSFTGETPGSAGQCQDSIEEAAGMFPAVRKVLDFWKTYHLNELNAGTREQMAALAQMPEDYGTSVAGLDSYSRKVAYLESVGLLTDRGYKYGSAWLYHPVTDAAALELEIEEALDALDGRRFGEAPDVDDAPDVSNSDDYIDSRDVIARIEALGDALRAAGIDPDETTVESFDPDAHGEHGGDLADILEEYKDLKELESQCEDCGDWDFGATLVRDSYFEDHAQDQAESIGAIDRNARWPNNHIDWEAAADELKGDYTSVDFKGVTYWLR